MRKRDELTNPSGCMFRAHDDEMTFVLLGRDEAAPPTIRHWIHERIALGKNAPGDPQLVEAAACAETMTRERSSRGTSLTDRPDGSAPVADLLAGGGPVPTAGRGVTRAPITLTVHDPAGLLDRVAVLADTPGAVVLTALRSAAGALARVDTTVGLALALTTGDAAARVELDGLPFEDPVLSFDETRAEVVVTVVPAAAWRGPRVAYRRIP